MASVEKTPLLTLLLVLMMLSAFGATQQDDAALQVFLYSRTDLFAGESWRLVTGHLVHFSWSHLISNVLAFATLALLIELQQGWKVLGLLLLGVALSGSVLMLMMAPQLQYYGGVSSINYGLLIWICSTHAAVRQSFFLAGMKLVPATIVIVVLFVHIGFQSATGSSLFAAGQSESAPVVAWQTHLACAVSALVLAVAGKFLVRQRKLISIS